jgi:exopolysaccharide biosynthesis polyprenyl glycosylphosphotransferase
MKLRYKDKAFILFASDVVVCAISFAIVLIVRYGIAELPYRYAHFLNNMVLMTATLSIILFILDLYSLDRIPETFLKQMLHLGVGITISALLSIFLLFLFRNIIPRPIFLLFYVTAFLLIYMVRRMLHSSMFSGVVWRVIIVGDIASAVKAYKIITLKKNLFIELIGYIDDAPAGKAADSVPCLGPRSQLLRIADTFRPDQIVIAPKDIDASLYADLMACMKRKIKLSDFRHFIEQVAEKVPIDYLADNWFFEELGRLDKRYFWNVKRSIDLSVGVIGIALLLPLLPFVAAAILLSSKGPLFYSQTRIGRGMRSFRLWKFRTMVEGADRNNVHWTTDDDARITKVGRFIRKVHFDELPQLYNILKGDMSLIGPRPEAESLVRQYRQEIPYYQERHMVTPGITGWAQINYPYGNSIEDTREKLKYDFYYIKNRSLLLDMIVLLRTTRIVLTGKGAL